MAATWNITNAERDLSLSGKSDVIKRLHYEVKDTAEDENGQEQYGHSFGAVDLPTDDLSDFTAFEDITPEIALTWCKAALGAEKVAVCEKDVSDQLVAKTAAPTTGTGVPW